MTARQIPGQLELILDVPALTEDQRADIATHIVTGWQAMGACRSAGNDTWFPDAGHAAKALAGCSTCPVRRSCLAAALVDDEEHGVWGGTTEIQRDMLRIDLAAGVPADLVLTGGGSLALGASAA